MLWERVISVRHPSQTLNGLFPTNRLGNSSGRGELYVQLVKEHGRSRTIAPGNYLLEKIVESSQLHSDEPIWSLHIAYMEGDFTFSTSYGIDRRLAIIEGALSLECGTGKTVHLDQNTPSFEYPSEFGAKGTIKSGLVVAAEIKTWRGHVSSRASLVRPKRRTQILPNAAISVAIPVTSVAVRGNSFEHVLSPRDALIMRCSPDHVRQYNFSGGSFALVELFDAGLRTQGSSSI